MCDARWRVCLAAKHCLLFVTQCIEPHEPQLNGPMDTTWHNNMWHVWHVIWHDRTRLLSRTSVDRMCAYLIFETKPFCLKRFVHVTHTDATDLVWYTVSALALQLALRLFASSFEIMCCFDSMISNDHHVAIDSAWFCKWLTAFVPEAGMRNQELNRYCFRKPRPWGLTTCGLVAFFAWVPAVEV